MEETLRPDWERIVLEDIPIQVEEDMDIDNVCSALLKACWDYWNKHQIPVIGWGDLQLDGVELHPPILH